jgi:hypothetical protein
MGRFTKSSHLASVHRHSILANYPRPAKSTIQPNIWHSQLINCNVFQPAVGSEGKGARDRVGDAHGALGSWIGKEMLVVAAALPSVDEGRAPLEEMSIAIVEESGEEVMDLGDRWHEMRRKG